MKSAILRILTREFDEGIIARDIIKERHELNQIRVKFKVKNGSFRRLSEACALVSYDEIKMEESRHLKTQAAALTVKPLSKERFVIENPTSGSSYEVIRGYDGPKIIWQCNCPHFRNLGNRNCKHAKAAELYANPARKA